MRRHKRFVIGSVIGAIAAVAIVAMVGFHVGTTRAASANGFQKVPITNENRNCDGSPASPPGSGSGSGYAIISHTVAIDLVAEVSLANASPNTSYGVRLIQTPISSTHDCGSYTGPYEGTIATDASGSGHVILYERVLPGATGAFVAINNTGSPGVDYYTCAVVSF